MVARFQSPFTERLLALFSHGWWVEVDTDQGMLRATRREGYYSKDRTFTFSEVHFIDVLDGADVDAADLIVQLVLKSEEAVPIAWFRGSSVRVPGTGVDLPYTAEGPFRQFVNAMKELLKVPFGRPLPEFSDESGRVLRCTQCSRPGRPNRPTCAYCGGAVALQ